MEDKYLSNINLEYKIREIQDLHHKIELHLQEMTDLKDQLLRDGVIVSLYENNNNLFYLELYADDKENMQLFSHSGGYYLMTNYPIDSYPEESLVRINYGRYCDIFEQYRMKMSFGYIYEEREVLEDKND